MRNSSPPNPEHLDVRIALHTAARRYCQNRFTDWIATYKELQTKQKWQVSNLFKPGWDYSENAYKVFPRYRLDGAIQVEVERLTPSSYESLEELRACLLNAEAAAENRLMPEFSKSTAKKALREEAADYRAYIQALNGTDLVSVEPLPFRRVITDGESKHLWRRLKEIWGIGNGPWLPLRPDPAPQNAIAFHTDYFTKMGGAQLLREALGSRGISRVLQLHEFGPLEPDYEIELSILEPMYASGGEEYCVSKELDWVVYASHESSITIAGEWLTESFRQKWPEWTHRTYGGPFATDDLKGTWKTK